MVDTEGEQERLYVILLDNGKISQSLNRFVLYISEILLLFALPQGPMILDGMDHSNGMDAERRILELICVI